MGVSTCSPRGLPLGLPWEVLALVPSLTLHRSGEGSRDWTPRGGLTESLKLNDSIATLHDNKHFAGSLIHH